MLFNEADVTKEIVKNNVFSKLLRLALELPVQNRQLLPKWFSEAQNCRHLPQLYHSDSSFRLQRKAVDGKLFGVHEDLLLLLLKLLLLSMMGVQ